MGPVSTSGRGDAVLWLVTSVWSLLLRLGLTVLFVVGLAGVLVVSIPVVTIRVTIGLAIAAALVSAWIVLAVAKPFLLVAFYALCVLAIGGYIYLVYWTGASSRQLFALALAAAVAGLVLFNRRRLESWRERVLGIVEDGNDLVGDAQRANAAWCTSDLAGYWHRIGDVWHERWRGRVKGAAGEWQVRLTLALWFRRSHRFHDIYVPLGKGVTQIDHVLISRRGVFVIETKNWSRWHRDADPIRQNEGHVDAVQQALGDERQIWSLVVLLGGARSAASSEDIVHGLGEMVGRLRNEPEVFDAGEARERASRLERAVLKKSRQLVADHRAAIRRRHETRKPKRL